MTMRKGIAIQTILLLLVGIIVVSILVYMIYRYTGGGVLNEQSCRSEMISWCNLCLGGKFQSGPAMSEGLKDCAKKYWNIDPPVRPCYAAKDCSGFLPGCMCGRLSGDSNGDGQIDGNDIAICTKNGCKSIGGFGVNTCTCE